MNAPRWLALAGCPIFLMMAITNLALYGEGLMTCGRIASPLSSMATMYLLMSVAHVGPWLSLGRQPQRL